MVPIICEGVLFFDEQGSWRDIGAVLCGEFRFFPYPCLIVVLHNTK